MSTTARGVVAIEHRMLNSAFAALTNDRQARAEINAAARTFIDIIEIFEFVLPDDNLDAISGSFAYLVSVFSSRNSSSNIKNIDNEFVTERSYEDGKDRKNKQIWCPTRRRRIAKKWQCEDPDPESAAAAVRKERPTKRRL
jgi:hypothetical protein